MFTKFGPLNPFPAIAVVSASVAIPEIIKFFTAIESPLNAFATPVPSNLIPTGYPMYIEL